MNDRSTDQPSEELPPDYLAPMGPEDDEGFVGVNLEPVSGAEPGRDETADEQPRLREGKSVRPEGA